MIEESILSKLKLKPSTKQVGDSFVRGGEVFVSDLPELVSEKAYFSECDERGFINLSNLLYCYIEPHPLTFSKEFLIDQPVDIILKVLLGQANRNRK